MTKNITIEIATMNKNIKIAIANYCCRYVDMNDDSLCCVSCGTSRGTLDSGKILYFIGDSFFIQNNFNIISTFLGSNNINNSIPTTYKNSDYHYTLYIGYDHEATLELAQQLSCDLIQKSDIVQSIDIIGIKSKRLFRIENNLISNSTLLYKQKANVNIVEKVEVTLSDFFIEPGKSIYFKIFTDNKYGIISSQCEMLLPCEYDEICYLTYGYTLTNKYQLEETELQKGFAELRKKFSALEELRGEKLMKDIILPAKKSGDSSFGLFHDSAHWCPAIYDEIIKCEILGDLLFLKLGDKYTLYNMEKVDFVIPCFFDNITLSYKLDYKPQRLIVSIDKKFGVIDAIGNVIVPWDKYDHIEEIGDARDYDIINKAPKYKVSRNDNGQQLYGIIDSYGEVIIDDIYCSIEQHIRIRFKQNDIEHYIVEQLTENGQKLYGVISSEGDVIIPCNAYSIKLYKDKYCIASEDCNGTRYCEVIADSGEIIVPCVTYDFIEWRSDAKNYRVSRMNGNGQKVYGVISESGEIIIPCDIYNELDEDIRYREVRHPSGYLDRQIYICNNRVSRINDEGRKVYGVISSSGEIIIPCDTYDSIEWIDDHNYRVSRMNEDSQRVYGVISSSGEIIVPCDTYDSIEWRSDTKNYQVSRMNEDSQRVYGVISNSGEMIIPCDTYNKIEAHQIGTSKDKIIYKVCCTDKMGNNMFGIIYPGRKGIPCIYPTLTIVEWMDELGDCWLSTRVLVKTTNDKYVMINIETQKQSKEYDKIYAASHTSKIFIVYKGELIKKNERFIPRRGYGFFGFINEDGEELTPCKYDIVGHFEEGLAPVKMNGKWGYVNEKGILCIACRYDRVSYFDCGFANVWYDGRELIIDKNGTWRKRKEARALIEEEKNSRRGVPDDYCGDSYQETLDQLARDGYNEAFNGDPSATWNID